MPRKPVVVSPEVLLHGLEVYREHIIERTAELKRELYQAMPAGVTSRRARFEALVAEIEHPRAIH